MAAKADSAHQMPCLYEIDISHLLSLDGEITKKLCLSLASISGNFLNETHLKFMSSDPRHCLYVLIDPIELWTGLGSPTIYCAIQVYLEGAIPDLPSLEDDNMGNAISKTFAYYPELKSKSLAGARIVHLFQIPDASQDGYGSTSLDILTRFYDGKAIVNAVQEKWAKLHYIGVYSDLTVNAVSRWEGYGFLVFFVGKLMISGADKRCSVIALAEQFRSIFVRNLSSQLRNLDHVFTLRILKSISSVIQPKELHHAMKLWKVLDHKRVEDFIKFPEILGKLELITHLVQDLAEGYFTGKLPIELSDDEETVLLVNVLQQQPPFIGDNDARSKLRNIFEKAIELYNTLSPEVVDNQNGNKRQKT